MTATYNEAATLNPLPFVSINNTYLTINPTLLTTLGPYSITIKLFDGYDSTEYPITFTVVAPIVIPPTPSIASSGIVVTNLGPPVFTFEPPPITLDIGQSFTHTLPPITDPNGDQFTVDVYLGEALLFTEYSPINGKLTFNPTVENVGKS